MTDTVTTATTPLVELRDIKVSFGGLHAVDGVSLSLMPGEVMGQLGITHHDVHDAGWQGSPRLRKQ